MATRPGVYFVFTKQEVLAPILIIFFKDEPSFDVLAAQLPGRGMRSGEAMYRSCTEAAQEILRVLVQSQLFDIPFYFVAHSMGTWLAYSIMCSLRARDLPLPTKVFFSMFPSPCTPPKDLPWRQSGLLSDEGLMNELKRWGNRDPRLFRPSTWKAVQRLIRADFAIFDECEFGEEVWLAFPDTRAHIFWGDTDNMVTQMHVEDWRMQFPDCRVKKLPCGHLMFTGACTEGHAEWKRAIQEAIFALQQDS